MKPDQSTRSSYTRLAWWLSGLAVVTGLVYLMATANTGPADPTEHHMSHGTAVFNSGMIVFREGLEAILIFAAVTASFLGADKSKRRPVVAGAVMAFGAAIATWFVVQALLDVASPLGPKLEAITGFLAIVVLLIVLNWFVHKVYWSDWIGRHHKRRQKLLTQTGPWVVIGLVALGFTTVYREGFEVVLFLQNLQLQSGTSTVLEGVAIGLACTAVVGVLTFWLHHKLPYRRMLIVTGALVAVVLMVMIGGTALSFMDLGWIPSHPTPFTVPTWMGTWFEVYSYWETIAAQLLAGILVVGSYVLAEHVKVNRRVRKGEQPAVRADAPPRFRRRRSSSLSWRAMRRSPGNVVLIAALSLALVGAGLAVAKKKHHHRSLPRGPYPSLGSCPVFPASSTAPNAPSAGDESAWNQNISTAPPDPSSAPTSPTSPPTAATSSTRTSARRASTDFPTRSSARAEAHQSTSPPTATSRTTVPIASRSRRRSRAARAPTATAT